MLESGIYDESYKRVLAVLKSVGVVLENSPGSDRLQISKNLENQDFCLSMLDKIGGKADLPRRPDATSGEESAEGKTSDGKKRRLKFWMKESDAPPNVSETTAPEKSNKGVVLCADEPTMTKQLNALSNIVLRALLFGGDQELLVLSETLDTNIPIFVERWYPGTGLPEENLEEETRPGLQYLNSLIALLRLAYDEGVVTNLESPLPLLQSFSNSYERLMASLVELGSGYIRPTASVDMSSLKPRTATEENFWSVNVVVLIKISPPTFAPAALYSCA